MAGKPETKKDETPKETMSFNMNQTTVRQFKAACYLGGHKPADVVNRIVAEWCAKQPKN